MFESHHIAKQLIQFCVRPPDTDKSNWKCTIRDIIQGQKQSLQSNFQRFYVVGEVLIEAWSRRFRVKSKTYKEFPLDRPTCEATSRERSKATRETTNVETNPPCRCTSLSMVLYEIVRRSTRSKRWRKSSCKCCTSSAASIRICVEEIYQDIENRRRQDIILAIFATILRRNDFFSIFETTTETKRDEKNLRKVETNSTLPINEAFLLLCPCLVFGLNKWKWRSRARKFERTTKTKSFDVQISSFPKSSFNF